MADKVQSLPQVYTDAVQVIKKAILDSQYKTARMAKLKLPNRQPMADDLQTVTINTQTLNGLDAIPGTDGLSYAEF